MAGYLEKVLGRRSRTCTVRVTGRVLHWGVPRPIGVLVIKERKNRIKAGRKGKHKKASMERVLSNI